MSDKAALLKAIYTHPDDDTPRLIFADWLDEHAPDKTPSPAAGPSARAEFIRVQCRLAQHPYDAPDYPELLERERDLALWMKIHDKESVEEVSGLPDNLYWFYYDDDDEWPKVRRGFPEEADFEDYEDDTEENIETIATALEEAFANCTIRTLRLEEALGEEIAGLMKRPVVAGLRGLYLDYLNDDEDVVAIRGITSSKHLTGLRLLSIDFPLEDEALKLMAKATNLGSLETLVMDSPSRVGIKPLTSARWFRNLRSLQLWLIGNDTMKSVAELPLMSRLVWLSVRGSITPSQSAIRKLSATHSFPQLARLHLAHMRLSSEMIEILSRAEWPLRHLRLESIRVQKAGVEALADAAFAETLQVLELIDCEITSGGIQALAASKKLAGLKHLNLSSNSVGANGLAAIARSPHLRGLRRLNLTNAYNSKVPIDARAVQNFLSALEMPELRHLELDRLPVGIRGAKAIAEGASFANLTRLSLEECGIGQKGAQAIVDSPSMSNLVFLDLSANRVGNGVSGLGNATVLPRLAECNLYRNRLSKWTLGRLRKRPGILT
ncbi:MAG: TIGR02996 domain-containing protein [Planctomycetia bacterium]|nr:TIGR02996 domain-containing protein [Planctomycetia bacterium]